MPKRLTRRSRSTEEAANVAVASGLFLRVLAVIDALLPPIIDLEDRQRSRLILAICLATLASSAPFFLGNREGCRCGSHRVVVPRR